MNRFSHTLVSTQPAYANGIGIAYMIGTYSECARYALSHGLRASTKIIPF
jgi:hypothetical protein